MNKETDSVHVCQVLSGIDKSMAFEWICDNLDERIEQSYILTGKAPGYIYEYLQKAGKQVEFIPFTGSKFAFPVMLWKYYWAFKRLKPDVVHAHIYPAPLLSLTAAKWAGVKRRVYTRHHSTSNHMYHPRGVRLDKYTNSKATAIVAISQNVRNVLTEMEGVAPAKIELIHHGFKFELFAQPDPAVVASLKAKYLLPEDSPVVGCISRFIELKGHKYIIKAFAELLKTHPNAKLVLANARGPDKQAIVEALKVLPEDRYVTIDFEPAIGALYHLFDVFVHVPINAQVEAFGQTYVEPLIAGVPSVFTLSGVAHEFIEDNKNALVVDYEDAEAIRHALQSLLENDSLRDRITERGKASVAHLFSLNNYIQKLNQLYLGQA